MHLISSFRGLRVQDSQSPDIFGTELQVLGVFWGAVLCDCSVVLSRGTGSPGLAALEVHHRQQTPPSHILGCFVVSEKLVTWHCHGV